MTKRRREQIWQESLKKARVARLCRDPNSRKKPADRETYSWNNKLSGHVQGPKKTLSPTLAKPTG